MNNRDEESLLQSSSTKLLKLPSIFTCFSVILALKECIRFLTYRNYITDVAIGNIIGLLCSFGAVYCFEVAQVQIILLFNL